MSQENVELVRLGYEAFREGNWELVQENSHPDLVIVQPPEVPDAKTYRGPHAFADAAADWPSQWEDFKLELVELIDVDDERVIAVTRHHGRGAESGIEMDFTVAYLNTLRDSKLARVDMFFSRAQALGAVGLRE
jgi:ketosteroid isomerase-like protein